MISVQVATVDDDSNYRKLIAELEEKAVHVDIGIHPVSGQEMVMIASTQEFGATIDHPGGQPFFITNDPKWENVSNAAPLSDGKTMVFLSKSKQGMGKTKPHSIEIPARPFIRSTADERRDDYAELMSGYWQDILDLKIGIKQALVLIGQQVESDVKAKMITLKTPPNAPATIRKKLGVDNPLIDTGALLSSIRYGIKNIHEQLVELGPGE